MNRPAQFYSVLIRSVKGKGGLPTIEEVYRVKLPGNPILGEGTWRGTGTHDRDRAQHTR